MGNLKGVGRIYQPTFVDTYSKVAFAKRDTMKTVIAAADILNDKVLSFFVSQGLPMLRILTDRGGEYYGKVENHDYELYLAINDIEHAKTKVKHLKGYLNNIKKPVKMRKITLNKFLTLTGLISHFERRATGALPRILHHSILKLNPPYYSTLCGLFIVIQPIFI